MKNEIKYEWDIETINPKDGDIIDHDFSETLKRLPEGPHELLVLVKSVGNNDDGLTDRSWAYVNHTKNDLPERFHDVNNNDCGRVPKKFHKELKDFVEKLPHDC